MSQFEGKKVVRTLLAKIDEMLRVKPDMSHIDVFEKDYQMLMRHVITIGKEKPKDIYHRDRLIKSIGY